MTPNWGVFIILPVWLIYLPCQTLMPTQPSPLAPRFSGLPCAQALLNEVREADTGFFHWRK
uniref:Conotoxin superfamily Z n=1 Tax=Conus magus TaxID=6492 RepID=A0A5P8I0Y7_CONMA|nr:hypothetical protein [Conus magus]